MKFDVIEREVAGSIDSPIGDDLAENPARRNNRQVRSEETLFAGPSGRLIVQGLVGEGLVEETTEGLVRPLKKTSPRSG